MNDYLGSPARRRLLAVGAGGLGLAGGLFSNIRTASAQTLSGAPPEVDRLAVRVVTDDSYQHALEASGKIGDVTVQRYAFALSKSNPRTLESEWGLSLHVESTRASETRQILVDFGFTAETLNNNLGLLAIDPAKLDAMLAHPRPLRSLRWYGGIPRGQREDAEA